MAFVGRTNTRQQFNDIRSRETGPQRQGGSRMQLVEQLQNRTFVDVKRCGAGQVEPDWRRGTQDAKCRDVAVVWRYTHVLHASHPQVNTHP